MEQEGFYVFTAVLLLATLLFFIGVGITGNAVMKDDNSNCLDSDSGQKIFVRGSVVGLDEITRKSISHIDRCYNNIYLKEGYCNKGILTVKTYKCKNGCLNGACIR